MDHQQQLAALSRMVEQAEEAYRGGDMALFVERTDSYLQALEQWQAQVAAEDLSEADREQLRQGAARLEQAHRSLMALAEQAKGEIGDEMTEVHRRAAGLKSYLEQGPSRISLTGRRKG